MNGKSQFNVNIWNAMEFLVFLHNAQILLKWTISLDIQSLKTRNPRSESKTSSNDQYLYSGRPYKTIEKFCMHLKKSPKISIGYSKLSLTPSKRFCTPNGLTSLFTGWSGPSKTPLTSTGGYSLLQALGSRSVVVDPSKSSICSLLFDSKKPHFFKERSDRSMWCGFGYY